MATETKQQHTHTDPDTLEALQWAHSALEAMSDHDLSDIDPDTEDDAMVALAAQAHQRVTAAIAKATGEQQA